MSEKSGGRAAEGEGVVESRPKDIAYSIWSKVGWYGWWQLISVLYSIGLGCAAIGDDMSSVTVPILRWRALVLCGFVYSGVFALGWMVVVIRMLSREEFRENWRGKISKAESVGLLDGMTADKESAQRAMLRTIWDRTAAMTGMQLLYHATMFLVYGMASTYIVFLYSYTDDSNVPRIQDAIDQGYSKGPQFMTYAVHKKISMLVWLQIGMLCSVVMLLHTVLVARFSTHHEKIERLVDKYNLEAFLAPVEVTASKPPSDSASKTTAYKRQNSSSQKQQALHLSQVEVGVQ